VFLNFFLNYIFYIFRLFKKCYWKFLKLIFFIFLYYTSIEKYILKIKKYYFNIFINKKYIKNNCYNHQLFELLGKRRKCMMGCWVRWVANLGNWVFGQGKERGERHGLVTSVSLVGLDTLFRWRRTQVIFETISGHFCHFVFVIVAVTMVVW